MHESVASAALKSVWGVGMASAGLAEYGAAARHYSALAQVVPAGDRMTWITLTAAGIGVIGLQLVQLYRSFVKVGEESWAGRYHTLVADTLRDKTDADKAVLRERVACEQESSRARAAHEAEVGRLKEWHDHEIAEYEHRLNNKKQELAVAQAIVDRQASVIASLNNSVVAMANKSIENTGRAVENTGRAVAALAASNPATTAGDMTVTADSVTVNPTPTPDAK